MTLFELSYFYNHLAIMLHSGIGSIGFFENILRIEKNTSQKEKIIYIIKNLKNGASLASVLKTTGLVPLFDIPLIDAGEQSGKLVTIFEALSKNYVQSADSLKKIKMGLYYPYFLFISSSFLPLFPDLILGNMKPLNYLIACVIPVIILLVATSFIFKIFLRSYYDLELAKTKHEYSKYIPFLRELNETIVIEKFCSSLSLMLESGISIIDALKLAGNTSASHELNLATRRIVLEVKSGKTLAAAFQTESLFSDDVIKSISWGETSGELPEFLNQCATRLKDKIKISIQILSKAIPHIIHLFCVAYVGYKILVLYLGSFSSLSKLL